MNSIKIIKQNARMWLGPKYTKKEYEINEYIQGFARQCIQDIKEDNAVIIITGIASNVFNQHKQRNIETAQAVLESLYKACPTQGLDFIDSTTTEMTVLCHDENGDLLKFKSFMR